MTQMMMRVILRQTQTGQERSPRIKYGAIDGCSKGDEHWQFYSDTTDKNIADPRACEAYHQV